MSVHGFYRTPDRAEAQDKNLSRRLTVKNALFVAALVVYVLFHPVLVFAQSNGETILIEVVYVEGLAEANGSGGSWVRLEGGEALASTQRLRLGRSAVVELEVGSQTLRLFREGYYQLSQIVDMSNRVGQNTSSQTSRNRLEKLHETGLNVNTPTATAGTRAGISVYSASNLSYDNKIQRGLLLASEQRYEAAREAFLDAGTLTTGYFAAQAQVLAASSALSMLDVQGVLDDLEGLELDPRMPLSFQAGLLEAQALNLAFAFEEARGAYSTLAKNLETIPSRDLGEDLLEVQRLVLLGLVESGLALRDTPLIDRSLAALARLGPASKEYAMAREMLK